MEASHLKLVGASWFYAELTGWKALTSEVNQTAYCADPDSWKFWSQPDSCPEKPTSGVTMVTGNVYLALFIALCFDYIKE